MHRTVWAGWVAAFGGLIAAGGCADSAQDVGEPVADASYVGAESCASCHETETDAWTGSHHDLAMQGATEATVLGDFDGVSFTYRGVTTEFTRTVDAFVIRTEGANGEMADFPVAYVFGVEPLQQYLIELDGGRLQAFDVAWDTRPAEDGGQRWFHVLPDAAASPGDRLHWTGSGLNWNYMCAACHSTNLSKGFDVASAEYATTWSDIDVSCEACHGPGSAHVELAESGSESSSGDWALSGAMADPGGGWVIDAGETIARRTEVLPDHRQVETCALCHSRRATISSDWQPGASIHQSALVSRLDERLYHADGQILDEVYVYGSFIQSPMYAAGVRCSDCHDPHTLELKGERNAVCSGCHLSSAYDTTDHHRHGVDTEAALCVSCHMPATTYMVVDPRRDHSMRVPRPDVSVSTGAPNACNGCHDTETSEWAAAVVADWYPAGASTVAHYAEVLHATRAGLPGSTTRALELAGDASEPAIARATALSLAARDATPATLGALDAAATDREPMLRIAAAQGLEAFPPDARIPVAFRLLRDSIRAVRIEAARALAPTSGSTRTPAQAELLALVAEEYVEAQMANSDHPSAHTNIGNLRLQQSRAAEAETAYRDALRIDPSFAPAYLNLADLQRAVGNDEAGLETLTEGLAAIPGDPALTHGRGLALIRLERNDEALAELRRAAESAPGQPRFAYVLAVALNSLGSAGEAIDVVQAAVERHPRDPDLLLLATQLNRDSGRLDVARAYAERLVERLPDDQTAARLLVELRRIPDV